MTRIAIHLLAWLALCPAVLAAELNRFDRAGSQIGFAYTQMGVSVDGRFADFAGDVAFDPARPGSARARIEVKVASIDTGFAEADAEVAGKDWFDARNHPTARFEAAGARHLGGNRYQVDGHLTIKGRTRAVAVPATFTADATGGTFAGQVTIRRADYAIGEGAWRDFSVVGNEISIRFRLRVGR
jgi:polyisoprenoid-binding protein YceI